jgi:hypothetical protein
MDKTQEALESETGKWLGKLEKDAAEAKGRTKEAEAQLTNMRAYISDCHHFQKEGDWVRAFEAVVYAWGIYETLKHLGLLL